MNRVSVEVIRDFLLEIYAEKLEQRGLVLSNIDDTYDLLREGIIDSLGILEMIIALEQQFGGPIELENLDPEKLTQIGSLSSYLKDQICRRV